jgi:S1-C subfamily serine protease
MLSKAETKIVLLSLLFLIPITGGLATYTVLEVKESKSFTNRVNGYVEPKWIGAAIGEAQKSLVTVKCSESMGSGFSYGLDELDTSKGFSFKLPRSDTVTSYIVTNAHVVENCGTSNPIIIAEDKTSREAKIRTLDIENDLALLETSIEIPPLYASYSTPFTGFWAMALGSPHSFAGSVTFGNIINHDDKLVFSTASLSPGNSGGPLLDNEGYVFGVNSGSKPIGQNFNISISVNVFCEKLVTCPTEKYWQEE